MDIKEIIGGLAAAIMFAGVVPYFWGIFTLKVRPHMFSWLVWGCVGTIGGVAQLSEGGGAGAWTSLAAGGSSLLIAALSIKYGEKRIARSDYVALGVALLAIPLWIVTKTPLWSVILVTAIDTIAFYPTYRKTWHDPYFESLIAFSCGATGWFLSLIALESYNLVTVMYPAVVFCTTSGFILMALWRRKALGK